MGGDHVFRGRDGYCEEIHVLIPWTSALTETIIDEPDDPFAFPTERQVDVVEHGVHDHGWKPISQSCSSLRAFLPTRAARWEPVRCAGDCGRVLQRRSNDGLCANCRQIQREQRDPTYLARRRAQQREAVTRSRLLEAA